MFIEFVKRMIKWRPEERSTARELLQDPWLFTEFEEDWYETYCSFDFLSIFSCTRYIIRIIGQAFNARSGISVHLRNFIPKNGRKKRWKKWWEKWWERWWTIRQPVNRPAVPASSQTRVAALVGSSWSSVSASSTFNDCQSWATTGRNCASRRPGEDNVASAKEHQKTEKSSLSNYWRGPVLKWIPSFLK